MSIVTGTVQGICKQTMLLWLVFSMAGIVVAAERLARLSAVDCDSFRLCSYIVEDEWGLLHEEVGVPKDKN